MEVKSCKHVSSFHYVIKIKLTRTAGEQVAELRWNDNIRLEDDRSLDDNAEKITFALNSDVGVLGAFARKKFAFPTLVSFFSLLPRFLLLVLLNEPYIRSLAYFIACVYKCAETSVLVLEPEVRAYSVVSLKSSSLFCTLTSVHVSTAFHSFPYLFPSAVSFDLLYLTPLCPISLAWKKSEKPTKRTWFAITRVTYRAYPTIERFYITCAPIIMAYLFFTFNVYRSSRILVSCHVLSFCFFFSPFFIFFFFYFYSFALRVHVWHIG